jgi:hypothetical protein
MTSQQIDWEKVAFYVGYLAIIVVSWIGLVMTVWD